ncbi:MAG: type II secretion system protein GspL [Acidiferrobacterales bacterium]
MATLLEQITDSISHVRSKYGADEILGNGADRIPGRMAGRMLELRIPATWPEEDKLDWCLRDGDKISAHGQVQNLSEIPAEARQARLRVWTPAADTLLTSATLPTRSQRKIEQALPYALEEKLLGDPGDMFFVHTLNADKSLAVAATARKQLEKWLTALAAADLHPNALAPITLAMPLLDKSWNITFWGKEAWVRTGMYSGFACPAQLDKPPHILVTALADARASEQAPESLLVCNPPHGFEAELWANELELEVPVDDVEPWESISPNAVSINLLQREFSPRAKKHGAFNRLLPAAAMLGIWFVGTLAINGWEWWQLSHEYQSARQEMVTILRASFPEQAKVIVDPYRQMRRNLELLGNHGPGVSDNSYLSLLAKAAHVLGRQTGSSLLGLEYRNKSLTIDVRLADYRTMETLKKALQSSKLTIEVKKASSHADGVSARIRLQSSASGARS